MVVELALNIQLLFGSGLFATRGGIFALFAHLASRKSVANGRAVDARINIALIGARPCWRRRDAGSLSASAARRRYPSAVYQSANIIYIYYVAMPPFRNDFAIY